ncbi:MAG: hypothetical protein HYZ86_02725 [Candidatus Omnitrophica bacterium]|nr:hypothetical protein [Candidatus Omnitrophota bacterium]
MFWIVAISFAVLVGVVLAIYAIPLDTRASRKKERRPGPLQENPKDKEWQAIAQRWEKHNLGLQGDIEKVKMEQKKALQDMEGQKARNQELIEKLALEKGWREKEQGNLDKAKAHERRLKEQIFRTEGDLEKEHTARLHAERDHQELKVKTEALLEEKRLLSTKAMSLETTVEHLSKEIKDLKRSNENLSRKREDIQWVAKSEFEEVKKLLLAKEQEISRLKNAPTP